MAGEAAFSANDAAVNVEDRDTELAKARSDVAFLEVTANKFPDLLTRLRDKLARYEEHVAEIKRQIANAEADEKAAHDELAAAHAVVESLTGE